MPKKPRIWSLTNGITAALNAMANIIKVKIAKVFNFIKIADLNEIIRAIEIISIIIEVTENDQITVINPIKIEDHIAKLFSRLEKKVIRT